MIHRLLSNSFYWLKAGRILDVVNKSVQYVIESTRCAQMSNTSCQRIDCLYKCMIKYGKVVYTDFLLMKTQLFETCRKTYTCIRQLMKKVNIFWFFKHKYIKTHGSENIMLLQFFLSFSSATFFLNVCVQRIFKQVHRHYLI